MNGHSESDENPVRDASTRPGRRGLTLIEFLVVLSIIGLLIALLMPATRRAREPARRAQCMNNLKQIALGLHNYADVWGAFPPAYTVDAEGHPLHSWRTLILPYIDQKPLYDTIDLSKAWNDPENAQAAATWVSVYSCPSADAPNMYTTYLAVVANGGCFRPVQPRQLSEITASHGETVMVIEADAGHAVHWMSPSDADEHLVLGLGAESRLAHSGGVNAAFVDGSVRFLSADAPAEERQAWISISGTGD
jgi:prepilin-type N-terminal cleavage/methylation domain-containing protein/prepilin-type processing-associated H-X9-DG protein